jgi:hypothetical protein
MVSGAGEGPCETHPAGIAAFHHVRGSVGRIGRHGDVVAFHLVDEHTGIVCPIGSIGHDEFQMVRPAGSDHAFSGQVPRETVVLDLRATDVIEVVAGIATVVHVVDRHSLAAAGYDGDVVLVASPRISHDARTADEEAEHIVVL